MRINVPGFTQGKCEEVIKLLATVVPTNGNIVEIGAHFGRTTVMWAMFSEPGVTVTAIDLWDDYNWHVRSKNTLKKQPEIIETFPDTLENCYLNRHETFLHYTKQYPNIKSIKSYSPPDPDNVTQLFNLDLIFIDGGHQYEIAKADMENCFHFAHKDTIVILDDTVFTEGWEQFYTIGPTRTWTEQLQENKIIELNRKDYCHGRGMSWGKYIL